MSYRSRRDAKKENAVRQMTEQNMINAFGGESMAHMRYRLFARQADKDGYGNGTPRVLRRLVQSYATTKMATC